MSFQIEKMELASGDVAVIRTENHLDVQAIERASGASILVLKPEDQIEKLDNATMLRAGWKRVSDATPAEPPAEAPLAE